MNKVKSLGTNIRYLPTYNSGDAPTAVGALSSIGEIAPTSDEIDVTTLDSEGGYREFLQGFKDSGEVTLSGYHNNDQPGQATMRALYASGASGYFWVTFPDATAVIFTAYVKGYAAGAAEVDGAVAFGATLRITGLVQVIETKQPTVQAKDHGDTATMDATATALTGSPGYQWYSNTEPSNEGGTIIGGKTNATYTTAALSGPDTYYYYCMVTVAGYRAVPSGVFVVNVAEA